jgi:hypothetical protein
MVIRIVTTWNNGTRRETTTNTDAQRGRYLFASMKAHDSAQHALRYVKNGYQYDTPRQYTGTAGAATTTVTLERGWA